MIMLCSRDEAPVQNYIVKLPTIEVSKTLGIPRSGSGGVPDGDYKVETG